MEGLPDGDYFLNTFDLYPARTAFSAGIISGQRIRTGIPGKSRDKIFKKFKNFRVRRIEISTGIMEQTGERYLQHAISQLRELNASS